LREPVLASLETAMVTGAATAAPVVSATRSAAATTNR